MTEVLTTSTDNAVLTPTASEILFKGRPGDTRLGEWVLLEKPSTLAPSREVHQCFLFGCPDDTGVRLNRGRGGAQEGPQEIRRAFYKMALPMDGSWSKLRLIDFGNIEISKTLPKTHKNAFQSAKQLASLDGTLVVLGGGHDFAAPGFLGFTEGRRSLNSKEQFGLINIDPHLDVRELEKGQAHSGTPFRQILTSKIIDGKNLVQFGCRENRNSIAHFTFCQDLGVEIHPLGSLRRISSPVSNCFKTTLDRLSRRADTIGVTLDMDSCADVVGTSAAPAIGFSLQELYDMAYLAGTCSQVRYFEIAEVAPSLDPTGKTALGAAEILYSFLCGRISVPIRNFNKTLKNPKKLNKTK